MKNDDYTDRENYGGNGASGPISIFFQEDEITFLFSELLRARGIETRIVESPCELTTFLTRIITEPQFIKAIPSENHRRCLVVGNKEALKNIQAISLSRPLTEEKIETALTLLLNS